MPDGQRHSEAWKKILDCWIEDLEDKYDTQRCLEKFEAIAKTPDDYLLCAETWSWLENEERTKSYLHKIETDCKTGRDWALLAFDWYSNIEDKLIAKEYMKKAETLSETFTDCETCATMYYFMDEIEKAYLCVQKAENMAKYAANFHGCSCIYNMLGNEYNEKRCLTI